MFEYSAKHSQANVPTEGINATLNQIAEESEKKLSKNSWQHQKKINKKRPK